MADSPHNETDLAGVPSRAAELDVWPGFQSPPPGYGQVPFYWWVGDRLTRERLSWQLEKLDQCQGITGLQINYAHGYGDGGATYGLTIPSDPPLFSEAWWELVDWFMGETRKRGWSLSLSDYTLGPGQGWCFDDLLHAHPEMSGGMLTHQIREVPAGEVEWQLPGETLMVAAWPLNRDDAAPVQPLDLRASIDAGVLRWYAPAPHRLVAVGVNRVPHSLDPMHPDSGRHYADQFFGQFERRFPDEAGRGLNFFFSDELTFNVSGNLWNDAIAEEFRQRKGYDLIPELPALFADWGARTSKVRLDYNDVMVALSEENYFKPIFDWHEERGMIFGCDHGSRGRDVIEFGDYFRTQRWNQGPGCDQPFLGCDLIKNKVASSIAHLYQRPRVWLEGFYSSGWGTSTEDLTRATLANFAQGQNLLSLHGLYYTTHGGYWEWAPPCNHFRMPYWPHMKVFLEMVQRLSYLLSQGIHCCDVAIFYPVAPVAAGLGGKEAVSAAFDAAEALYARTLDFDFMDFQSLDRAEIIDGCLSVGGERYRVLVLPGMRAIRWSSLQKALAFHRAGGLVLALGALPEASDRAGATDPELDAAVGELFGNAAKVLATPEALADRIASAFLPDVSIMSTVAESPDFIHRRIGSRDVYLLHGLPAGTEVRLRATGAVELWDPWSGESRTLPVIEQTAEFTRLRLPQTEHDAQVIVFSAGSPVSAVDSSSANPSWLSIDGDWEFELQPTLDNQFGDFHWPPTPAFIGAEARRLQYGEGEVLPEAWQSTTVSYGPQFIRCRQMPDPATLSPPPDGERCSFSWRWGLEDDPGIQGYHGLKGYVHDSTIAIGHRVEGRWETTYQMEEEDTILWTTVQAAHDQSAYLHTGLIRPAEVWLNGRLVTGEQVELSAGANPLVLRYAKEKTGRTYFVVSTTTPAAPKPERVVYPAGEQPPFTEFPLTSKWEADGGRLPFDIRPDEAQPIGWYRFTAPPGLRAMTILAHGEVTADVGGQPMRAEGDGRFCLDQPALRPATVTIRIVQRRGLYGGAAIPLPIRLDCAPGLISAGDWSQAGVLECYSGGAWYRQTITLTAAQAAAQLSLDLGKVVASVEVRINGKTAGIRIAPPWQFDLSGLVCAGENRLELLVYNTLANHYVTIPTHYRGELTSGLLGPVALQIQ